LRLQVRAKKASVRIHHRRREMYGDEPMEDNRKALFDNVVGV
jgi:hypothetical protein